MASRGRSRRRTLPSTRMQGAPLRILFTAPAWWPAVAFGGPIPVTRELTERLAAHGHEVSVVTSTLVDLHSRPSSQTRTETHGGVRVTYLSTPISYRWMGITPSLPLALERLGRPDVVHVLGYRGPHLHGRGGVGVAAAHPVRVRAAGDVRAAAAQGAAQARARRDALPRGRRRCGRRRSQLRARGRARPGRRRARRPRARARQRIPGSRFDAGGRGVLRGALGIPEAAPIALYAGRIASGKGIDHLLAAARELTDMHLVLVGPDDRHGTIDQVRAAETTGRVHTLEPTAEPPSTCIRTRTCSACPRPARASAWLPPKPPLPERRSSSPTGAASPASSGKGKRSSFPTRQRL